MAYTKYEPIEFENGKLVSPAKVDPETGVITPAVYSCDKPIGATTLNHLEQGLIDLENLVLTSGTASGGGNEPVGTIKLWPTENAPNGYLICQGQAVSRTEYSDLFNIIGTSFGTGDGSTTFNVPDMRGRVVIGTGSFDETHTFKLAQSGGEYEHILTISEMPNHNHKTTVDNTEMLWDSVFQSGTNATGVTVSGISKLLTSYTGDSQAHNNMQPYTVVNYIIKAVTTTQIVAEVEDSLDSNSTTNAPSIHAVNEALNITESELDLTNTACGNNTDYPIYVNKLRKQNKMVTLDFEGYATNFVDGYNLVGTIPSEYLPKAVGYYADVLMYFNCVVAGMNAVVQGKISPTGEVLIHSNADNWPVGYMDNNLAFRIHESWFTK